MLGFALAAPRKHEQIPSIVGGASSNFGKNVILYDLVIDFAFAILKGVLVYPNFITIIDCATACGRKAQSVA